MDAEMMDMDGWEGPLEGRPWPLLPGAADAALAAELDIEALNDADFYQWKYAGYE